MTRTTLYAFFFLLLVATLGLTVAISAQESADSTTPDATQPETAAVPRVSDSRHPTRIVIVSGRCVERWDIHVQLNGVPVEKVRRNIHRQL